MLNLSHKKLDVTRLLCNWYVKCTSLQNIFPRTNSTCSLVNCEGLLFQFVVILQKERREHQRPKRKGFTKFRVDQLLK